MDNFYFLGTVKSIPGSSINRYLNQCKIANYDLILTVLLLFALIFLKVLNNIIILPYMGDTCFLCR